MQPSLLQSTRAQDRWVQSTTTPANSHGIPRITGASTRSIASIPKVRGLAAYGASIRAISLSLTTSRITMLAITRYGGHGKMGLATLLTVTNLPNPATGLARVRGGGGAVLVCGAR